jgi:hypothetical protein
MVIILGMVEVSFLPALHPDLTFLEIARAPVRFEEPVAVRRFLLCTSPQMLAHMLS